MPDCLPIMNRMQAEITRDLAEARATNAVLHRRAQGVEAGKPDDAETIRRLRAAVVATEKHAKCVIDRDRALRDALSVANYSVVRLTAERDAAYERGLRRGMAIARRHEWERAKTVDWTAAEAAMEREIEEAKR